MAGAAAGGTVRVPAGTYAEDVLVVDKPLTIEPADPDDPPVLTGYSRIEVASPPQAGAGGAGAEGPVVIRGLVFRDTTLAPDGGGLASISVEPTAPGAPGAAPAAMPVTIEGNTFRNTCGAAVRAAALAPAPAGASPPPIAGLIVKDNRFYDIGGNRANCGVAAGGGAPPAGAAGADLADAIVAGRHVVGAGGGSSSSTAAAAAAPQLAGMAVQDNYIFGTTYTGIRIAGADGLAVTGNHIEGVPDDGVRIIAVQERPSAPQHHSRGQPGAARSCGGSSRRRSRRRDRGVVGIGRRGRARSTAYRKAPARFWCAPARATRGRMRPTERAAAPSRSPPFP